jgi:hypothetical protein
MPPPDDPKSPPTPSTVSFPTSIKVAGLLWIGSGVLGLFQIVFVFAGDPLSGRGGMDGCGLCCLCGMTDLLFLAFGYETTFWRIRRSTAVNGIVSIVVGWAYAAQAVLVIHASFGGRAASTFETWLFGGLSALIGLALVAAGVLAIAGWRHYSHSRAGHGRLSEMSEEQADFDDLSTQPPDDDED